MGGGSGMSPHIDCPHPGGHLCLCVLPQKPEVNICFLFYLPSVCLSICLLSNICARFSLVSTQYLFVYLSTYLHIPIYLPTYIPIYLSIYLSINPSVFLSECLSIDLSICLTIYLSINPSIYLSNYLSYLLLY